MLFNGGGGVKNKLKQMLMCKKEEIEKKIFLLPHHFGVPFIDENADFIFRDDMALYLYS